MTIVESLAMALLLISVGFVGFVIGYRTGNTMEPFEQISEQQYREQSLQYLEDIRNAVK